MTHNQGAHGLADQLVISGYTPTPSGAGIRYPSQGSIGELEDQVTATAFHPTFSSVTCKGRASYRKRDALNAGVLGAEHNPLRDRRQSQ